MRESRLTLATKTMPAMMGAAKRKSATEMGSFTSEPLPRPRSIGESTLLGLVKPLHAVGLYAHTFACAGYLSYFSCRLATSTCLRFGEADGVVPEALWYQAFGLRSLALTAIVLWMRLTHLSSASEQLGPVVSAMWRVGYAVATFGLLLLCVTMGFVSLLVAWFGSTDYHAHYDDQGGIFEYRSLYYGLLTLCRALFGDFSFDFSGVGDPYWRALAETLMVLYMLMGAIAMLNILIAIVCSVFARVVETSEQESAALVRTCVAHE